MDHVTPTQTEVEALNHEYQAHVDRLRASWLTQNRMNSGSVFEILRPGEDAEVYRRIAALGAYIAPRAEAWWNERGFVVIWPDDESKPMRVYKMEAV